MLAYSIIIPTLNADRVLDECLSHIAKQNYPRDHYEIIIADGGSTDKTLEIAAKYNARIVDNPLKTAEAGKMAGLRAAHGEYCAFIDSDNILVQKNWLYKMEAPFDDPQIIATEPIMFVARATDHPFTRYFAYIGMGDPINLFLGNYDRYSYVTDKWTELRLDVADYVRYKKIRIQEGEDIPTIGANGFVVRRKALKSLLKNDFFFDVDIIQALLSNNPNKRYCYIAKVETGLVHIFSGTLATMMRKYRRKIKDYIYYNAQNMRAHSQKNQDNMVYKLIYPGGVNIQGLTTYILSCLTVFPLIVQAVRGYRRKPDWVWILHPIITELTFYIYTTERIKSFFRKSIYDRKNWSQ